MADGTFNTDTHVAVKRTHRRGFVIIALAALAVVTGFAVYYSKMVSTDGKGHLVVSAPDMSSLKSSIVLNTPQGSVIAQIPQAAQPLPNGKTMITTDGFDVNQRLQRDVERHDRFDPIDRLDGKIDSLGENLSDALKTATKSLADSLQAQADKQNTANANLATALTKVDGKVDDLAVRVGKVEQAQATPAPAQPAPQAPPAATSQATPAPSATAAPQASAQAPARYAGNFVTPQTASDLEKAYMVGALKTLGQAPAKLSGFEVTEHVEDFKCPDGSNPIKVGGRMGADKVFYARFACKHVVPR